MSNAAAGGRISRLYAWVVVALRYPIVLAWIAALVASIALLPWLSGSSTAPLDDIVKSDADALVAQQRGVELFGATIATDSIVVARNPRGLTRGAVEAHARAAGSVTGRRELRGVRAAVPLANVAIPGVRWRERNTTLITYLFLDPDLNLLERDRLAHRYADELPRPAAGETRGVTGSGPARLAQFRAIDDVLPWMEMATIVVIFAIVALYFRSLGAPLVTLATAGLAYVIAVRVLAWGGERLGVRAPSEIEPVLVVLLLGLVTDYTVFFMAETRRRLAAGDARVAAARAATARIAPLVVIAGALIAGGAVSLLAGEMKFFRVFGPALALAALVVTLVCVTLVPALMAMFGPWLFGRRARDAAPPSPADRVEHNGRHARWRLWFAGPLGALHAGRRAAQGEGRSSALPFLIRLLYARPAAALLAALCVGALLLAATNVRAIDLTVSFVPSLPRDSEPRRAGDAAAQGFRPGIVAPTEIIVESPRVARRPDALAQLQRSLGEQPGVAAVIGPAPASQSPLRRFVVSRDGGAARYVVLMRDEPTGAAAIASFTRLQGRMPQLVRAAGVPGARVSYAGETALARETVDALAGDLRRVALVTALAMLVLLGLFLRALLAPLLLLSGSLLACGAAFGLTALLLPAAVGDSDLVYYVPLVGAVMLVGLGSDYNVLIAGRIREEMRRRRVREAIAIATPSSSRAITVAGITLAATFALLAMVPLRPFRELALLMTLGVLTDALFVRPLLIPALIALGGRATWWPSRFRAAGSVRALYDEVARRAGYPEADVAAVTWATLVTLGERIPAREAGELGRHLPPALDEALGDGGGHGQPFASDEFVRRVAARTGFTEADASTGATAVVAALGAALPESELEYVRAVLPGEYAWLFADGRPPPARRAVLESSA